MHIYATLKCNIYIHIWREKKRNFIMNTHMPTIQPKKKASQPQLRSVGWEGAGHGIPLQYSCLENPVDRGAWRDTVHRVAKN